MQLDIIKNAKRNIFFGFINKLIVLLNPFVTRTVIIYQLGNEYLGLDSLFTSILTVLSLSEMGFSSAVVYNLYKPIANSDTEQVNALLNFYRKAYRFIGCFILFIGILLIPFIPNLIKGSHPNEINLTRLYLIYLTNTVLSYFMYAYLTALITVYQRNDLNSRINSCITLLSTIIQIIIIIVTKDYYLYAILLPIATITNNIWTAKTVKKYFPNYHCSGKLTKETQNDIKKVVIGTFIQKACAITRNSLDSIFISAYLGLSITAIYNNYYLISHGITSLMGLITTSFAGGIGNHVANRSKEQNFKELQKLDFIYLWLGGWASICLLCLYQPFIKLWLGENNILPMSSVVLFVIYFYLLKLGDIRYLYNAANGLWWHQKWRSISETLLNCILNAYLGYKMGVNGIILATIISLFLCNCIWASKILFETYFDLEKYYYSLKQQILYTATTFIIASLTYCISMHINLSNLYIELIYKLILCTVLPNILYFVVYKNWPIYNESIMYIKNKK